MTSPFITTEGISIYPVPLVPPNFPFPTLRNFFAPWALPLCGDKWADSGETLKKQIEILRNDVCKWKWIPALKKMPTDPGDEHSGKPPTYAKKKF
jgi:hypothetical protein